MKHKGQLLKDTFWLTASCDIVKEFEYHMNVIEKIDRVTHKYLKTLNPKLWSRSHFQSSIKCDILVNNLCESWNAYILEARQMPILNMLEWIRKKLMARIQVKKEQMEKWIGPLTPEAKQKLERRKRESANCFATYAGDLKFEV